MRKIRPIEDRFWEKVKKTPTCWLWTAGRSTAWGYGSLAFKTGKRPKYAHRFSYELHKGQIPKGKIVMHSCDNPRCVNPEHLVLGTHFDNAMDRTKKGRTRHGDKHPFAKFTSLQVKMIRELHSRGMPEWLICKTLNSSQGTINDILKNRTWKHC